MHWTSDRLDYKKVLFFTLKSRFLVAVAVSLFSGSFQSQFSVAVAVYGVNLIFKKISFSAAVRTENRDCILSSSLAHSLNKKNPGFQFTLNL